MPSVEISFPRPNDRSYGELRSVGRAFGESKRNVAVEGSIVGAIDDAHSSLAKLFEDSIM
jgi:hypothetical protein